MASHIRVVAVLLIVHGSIEAFIGVLLAAMGPIMFGLITLAPGSRSAAPAGPSPEILTGVMSAVYIVMGLIILALGVLRIVAGIKNLRYRSRTLGIVALAAGVLSMMTCYCMPTSIALMVYGLVVYTHEQSARAFGLGEQGVPPESILGQVSQPPPPAQPFNENRFGSS